MLGLKRGTVRLLPHQTSWEESAAQTIELLWTVMDGIAVDIQHTGLLTDNWQDRFEVPEVWL